MSLRSFDEIEYFEDYRPGDRFATEPVEITSAALRDYVSEYGPIPLDDYEGRSDAVSRDIFPDMAGIGICFAHLIRSGFLRGHGLSSPGLTGMRAGRRFTPGDRVRVELECLDSRASRTRDDRGYANFHARILNQDDELVLEFRVAEVLARRPKAGA